jgi:NTE family protein
LTKRVGAAPRCLQISARSFWYCKAAVLWEPTKIAVYQALHDAGIEPDWVIGTSIGPINASLIAGNAVADRLSRLREFWSRVQLGPFHQAIASLPVFGGLVANWLTVIGGIPGFFKPNPFAFAGPHIPLGTGSAAFYSTEPLERTLNELVDFTLVERHTVRPDGRGRECADR